MMAIIQCYQSVRFHYKTVHFMMGHFCTRTNVLWGTWILLGDAQVKPGSAVECEATDFNALGDTYQRPTPLLATLPG